MANNEREDPDTALARELAHHNVLWAARIIGTERNRAVQAESHAVRLEEELHNRPTKDELEAAIVAGEAMRAERDARPTNDADLIFNMMVGFMEPELEKLLETQSST